MLDASTKIQSGFLTFNFGEMGNFDECIAIDTVIEDLSIYGKYCLGYVTSSINSTARRFRSMNQQVITTLGKLDKVPNYNKIFFCRNNSDKILEQSA